MKLRFLGTGTSVGVPAIGCRCRTCMSTDQKDKRLRCSAMVETEQTRVLIDIGPDFRTQMLPLEFRKLDAVLITHIHFDHAGGLDDLRPFCQFGEVNVYAGANTARSLHQTVPYCFAENRYPGAPKITLDVLEPHKAIKVNELEITPFTVMHGQLPILAFRIGDGQRTLVYITDMKTMPQEEWPYVEGADTLVVNALRYTPDHHAHQNVDDALKFAERVGAQQTWLIHSCHDIGLHEEVNAKLPPHVQLAYDGQVVEI